MRRGLVLVLVLAACGDDSTVALPDAAVDAFVADAAPPDARGPYVGGPCWVAADCPDPAICWTANDGFPGGVCVIEGCTSGSCPSGASCLSFTDGVSRCIASCDDPTDCRQGEGYTCDTDSVCWPADGAVLPGGSCASDEQCAGSPDAVCYAGEGFIGGYCIPYDCTAGSCPGGATCVDGLFSDGAAGCMMPCTTTCRAGYTCQAGSTGSYCFPACADDDGCPGDFACRPDSDGELVCMFAPPGCDAAHPTGDCPPGSVCHDGACAAFACDSPGLLEPNETQGAAVTFPTGAAVYEICAADHDWYSFTPGDPALLYRVGVDSAPGSGDLQGVLVFPDASVRDEATIDPAFFMPVRPIEPVSPEVHTVLGDASAAAHFLHVRGASAATTNEYRLVLDTLPWTDGASCTGAGFSADDCRAQTGGVFTPSKLIVFPHGAVAAAPTVPGFFFLSGLSSGGNGYTETGRQYTRREVIMAVRHAHQAVEAAFPGSGPLGIGDVGLPDGNTPEGHPDGTHYEGANLDIGYYIHSGSADDGAGNMAYRQICCDQAVTGTMSDYACVCTEDTGTGCDKTSWTDYGTCQPGTQATHIVDAPRTALFIAKLAATGRLRVLGLEDKVMGASYNSSTGAWTCTAALPSVCNALDDLLAAGTITAAERTAALDHIATASVDGSWVWHFNHMHASFWTGASSGKPTAPARGLWPDRSADAAALRNFYESRQSTVESRQLDR